MKVLNHHLNVKWWSRSIALHPWMCLSMQVRAKALKTLNLAHTIGPRSTAFPLEDIVRILMFRDAAEATDFIQQYGLNVNEEWVSARCLTQHNLLWPHYYTTATNTCKPQILVFISHNLITFLKGHMMAFSTFRRHYGSEHEGIHSHCYTWIWTNSSVIIKPWKGMYNPEYLIQMSNDGFLKCCQQFGRA